MAEENILLIDNTVELASLLKADGYQIIRAKNGIEGLIKASQSRLDLVILNQACLRLLPPELAPLIAQLSYMPVLVLGHRHESSEILEMGADSFICSPPHPRELKAKINSILRRKRKLPPEKPDGGDSKNTGRNMPNLKTPLGLTPTENRIDACLKLNQGHLIEYQSLINAVWGKHTVSLDTLHYYMRRLKSKLSDSKIIQKRGVGYWLE
ncbi:response regulator transcription factor [Dehalococcoides mccartyi]|uniref:Response regulator n=1 Tax=Dehalococcoides mccartyi (strain ATCC BAA-2266 / KCTC 15142 / 195) TaxID=243164 RepID=Q3Z6C8_DEHM1|nr:winged helix-turn-helix domain-containing protein [Dehalococcoides mccartyi]AAW39261.1 response regulator [Dehalococcoides mccartyi 195]